MVTPKRIGEIFYETRVLRGRDCTLRRFAEEALGASIDPVMLGYIEKGQRFPSETLVRRLARIRRQDERELLAVLWRDRLVHAMTRELRRVLDTPRDVPDVEDAEIAVLVSRAIAALPDDGGWIAVRTWHRRIEQNPDRRSRQPPVDPARLKQVHRVLREQQLIEEAKGRVRRHGRHYVARSPEEQRALAAQFCTLFATGMVQEIALPEVDTGSYLRNHYLNIRSEDIPEFRRRLEAGLRALAEEFAADPGRDTQFLNVLVAAAATGGER